MSGLDDGRRLEVSLSHRLGGLALDVAFTVSQPWTVLFAPSGAGKSTVLRAIAGLVRPEAGRIVWHGATGEVTLTETARGVFVAPHQREIRLVSQQAALFPHLTVAGNVNYAGVAGEEILQMCRIGDLMGRRPGELSGGERQRVALARAIAGTGFRMLLLDEPFSGLDVGLRQEMVAVLKPWLAARGVPVLQVTHDAGEVFAVGAEVVRMQEGRVVAQGAAGRVLGEERERLMDALRQPWGSDVGVGGDSG